MKNINCIAIDDEPMALLVIKQFCLRRGGITLTTFSEPRIGLKEIQRCKPDLVFLDIQMNSISGLMNAASFSLLHLPNTHSKDSTSTQSTSCTSLFPTNVSIRQ